LLSNLRLKHPLSFTSKIDPRKKRFSARHLPEPAEAALAEKLHQMHGHWWNPSVAYQMEEFLYNLRDQF